jgi:cytidylate kinase
MAIVMISSTSRGGREEIASNLADKTGWPVLSREELIEQARESGIKIGRLEMSIIRKPAQPEHMAREKNLFLAFLTAAICEKAAGGDLIYCGRAGHLLLPGVSHKLRVGLTIPREILVQQTARDLNLSLEKARTYIDQLDQDIESWARFVHHVDLRQPGQYDLVLSLENMGMSNAASILCETAGLTDFRPTPASLKRITDLHLAARARLRLALDRRTAGANLQVLADNGVLTVTYPPRQEVLAEDIPEVLVGLENCRRIQCTLAETSILWVQEHFQPDSDGFQQITSLAQRWGAAIELMRMLPQDQTEVQEGRPVDTRPAPLQPRANRDRATGGVEDDEVRAVVDDGGLGRTEEELVSLGRSGGQQSARCCSEEIINAAGTEGKYSLVVVGDLFLDKDLSARTRLTREFALAIRDRLKAPVITADELKTKFTFGPRQVVTLFSCLALVVLCFVAVFSHQTEVLDFIGGPLHEQAKWLAPIVVILFVPLFAYVWGTATALALQLLRID